MRKARHRRKKKKKLAASWLCSGAIPGSVVKSDKYSRMQCQALKPQSDDSHSPGKSFLPAPSLALMVSFPLDQTVKTDATHLSP